MSPVTLFLSSIAGILVIGAIGEVVFRKSNVPDVVWLIAAGVVFGPVLGIVTRERLSAIAPFFGPITLVFVLFDGGSKLRFADVRRSAPRAGLLATITFALAVAGVAGAAMIARALGLLPGEWSWTHALLVGAILGGSSSIIVMPAMAQARVPDAVSNLVGLESAFTDAFCVVGASALMGILAGGASGAGEASRPWVALLRSFGIGAGVGLAAGALWLGVLRLLKKSQHAYPLTLSGLLLLYVVVDALGGSAALGVLAFAIVLGNARSITAPLTKGMGFELDEDVRTVHGQLTFVIKSFFFTFIGAMLGPPWGAIAVGAALGVILFVTRVPGVRLATIGSGLSTGEAHVATVALPRGMAAGVLATMPAAAGIPFTDVLPPIVFAAVVTTILLFAIGFPIAKRR